jgi:hypothetical protein
MMKVLERLSLSLLSATLSLFGSWGLEVGVLGWARDFVRLVAPNYIVGVDLLVLDLIECWVGRH